MTKLTGDVMKKCKYVHASKRDELERVIQDLQHQVLKIEAAELYLRTSRVGALVL